MPVRRSQGDNGQRVSSLTICPPNPVPSRKAATMDARSGPSEISLEASLSSALLASDKTLGNVVRQVDEISKALRLDATDPDACRVAVHAAVWSAVRHVIVERELRYLALTDDLTCLYNRRGFFAAATQQLKLARRNSHKTLLLFRTSTI